MDINEKKRTAVGVAVNSEEQLGVQIETDCLANTCYKDKRPHNNKFNNSPVCTDISTQIELLITVPHFKVVNLKI